MYRLYGLILVFFFSNIGGGGFVNTGNRPGGVNTGGNRYPKYFLMNLTDWGKLKIFLKI